MSSTHLSSNAAMYSSGRPSGITVRITTSEIEYNSDSDESDASSDDSSPSFGDDDNSGSTTPLTDSVPTTPVDTLSSGDDDEDKNEKEQVENDHEPQDDASNDQLPTEQDLLELEEALKGYFENEAGGDEDEVFEECSGGVVEDFLTAALSDEDGSAQQSVVGESDAAGESDEEDWEEVKCGGGGSTEGCDDLEVTNQEETEVGSRGKQAKQETITQSAVVVDELTNDDHAFVPHNGPHPIEAAASASASDATTLTRTTKRKRTRSNDGKLVADDSKEEEDTKAIPQEKKHKKDRPEPTPIPEITKPSRSSRKKRSTVSTPQVVSQRRQKELPAGRQLKQEIWGFLSHKEMVTKLATQDRLTTAMTSRRSGTSADPFTGTNTNPGGGSGSSSSSAAGSRARSRKRTTTNEVIDLAEDDETPSRQHIHNLSVTPASAPVSGSPYISSITPEGFYYSAGVGPQYPYTQSLPATSATTTTTRARLPPNVTPVPVSPYEFSNPQQMGYHHLAEVHSRSQAHAIYATQLSHYPPMMGGAPGPYSAVSPPTIPIDNPIRSQYSGVYASSSFSGSATPGVQSSSTGQQQFRFIAMDYSHDTGKMNEVGKRNRSRRV
ncbi:hypothetical protein V5O48_016560 [Marasmius crinis-equi]|uniref:Uncharacterized protein n=1 Tax=Marasmius crinis-equi TaxID=585013 RepID=A0ABR3ERG4_9AGAR